jgi:PAS domain S-box-containing protein
MRSAAHGSSRSIRRILYVLTIVAGCACGAWWLLGHRAQPDTPVRVGFTNLPPFYFVATDGAPRGIAVDVLNAAARRRGIPLEWVAIDGTLKQAFLARTVDLWATVSVPSSESDFITEPWLISDYYLLYKADTPLAVLRSMGTARIAVAGRSDGPEWQLASRTLSNVTFVAAPSMRAKLQMVCDGRADAGFSSGRQGLDLLMSRPAGCESTALSFVPVPGASTLFGIGSTREAAGVAAALRNEIEEMASDGTLAGINADWSLTTSNELRIIDALREGRTRGRLSLAAMALLALALAAALYEVRRNRQLRAYAEQRVREQQQHRILFERNMAGVYRMGVEGVFLDCNDAFAKMLGCASREDVIGKSAWGFAADARFRDGSDARNGAINQLRAQHSLTNHEMNIVRADGQKAILLQTVTMIDARDGEPAMIEGTALDISRERELEEQYRQAQKLESIGRLAGSVAHDFNNTLTAITGYVDLALSDLEDSHPSRAMLLEIQKAGEHAETLTRQLLAFSRRQHLRPTVVNLNRVVDDTRGLLVRVVGENVGLVFDLCPTLANVKADAGQLQQVLMNLVINARDAMPSGGALTISTANVMILPGESEGPDGIDGECVRLTVADTGHGMDEATQGRIFEPFFTTKASGKGTGLGLSTVYGIVRQSGGHVGVRSVPDGGTTFDIDLPAVEEILSEAAELPPRETKGGSETILVVEDQDEVRHMVAASLSRFGYHVIDAPDGQRGIEACRTYEGSIDLVLTDIVMPGLSGPAVGRACQQLRPGVRVLYMSGYTTTLIREEIGPDTAMEYIQKPFSPVDLARKVRQVLGPAFGG